MACRNDTGAYGAAGGSALNMPLGTGPKVQSVYQLDAPAYIDEQTLAIGGDQMIEFETIRSPQGSFIVERKGIGHPDTLADGIAEFASIRYSKYCLENFGTVLHHNLDKTYIAGGLASAEFRHGCFSEPIKIYINGRCSSTFAGRTIPLQEIFVSAVRTYLSAVLPHCEPSSYQVIVNTTTFSHSDYWFNPRSLDDVPDAANPHANDTSYTVGYWPLTKEETVLHAIETALVHASREREKPLPIGQDIKLMYCGTQGASRLTLCVPTISQLTDGADHYYRILAEAKEIALQALSSAGIGNTAVRINSGDERMRHEEHYMLTSGTCLEGGEEGVVGRGNNHLGVISSNRPHAMEGPSGKNPQYHVGKVQTFLAQRCAEAIYQATGVSTEIHMVSQIGDSIREPDFLRVSTGSSVDQKTITEIIAAILANVQFREELLAGWLIPAKGILHHETIGL